VEFGALLVPCGPSCRRRLLFAPSDTHAGAGDGVAGVYARRYTWSVAKTVPVREFRTNLSQLLSDVADRRDHVLVTRNGKPAAALVPIDEYEALEETAEILSDSATLAAIEAGLADLARGDTVTLADLRTELAHRRSDR
jgi:prevent-host-death family protein